MDGSFCSNEMYDNAKQTPKPGQLLNAPCLNYAHTPTHVLLIVKHLHSPMPNL